jgi:hypothetical protein
LNLPPEWRSQLKSIQLLGVINSKLLKEVGVQQFLQPIIDDLLKLQFGVDLKIRNEKRKWFGIVVNFVGDRIIKL